MSLSRFPLGFRMWRNIQIIIYYSYNPVFLDFIFIILLNNHFIQKEITPLIIPISKLAVTYVDCPQGNRKENVAHVCVVGL